MQADFWHARWEQNQIAFHQEQINDYLQQFWDALQIPTTAEQPSQVFVPLCGKTRDMLWLQAQGYAVLGVELSPIAVRDFFAENQLTPTITSVGSFERWEANGLTILLGDFFALTAKDVAECQAVFDRASLIALPPAMRADYAQHLMKILPDTAPVLLVTMEYEQAEMKGPPFAVHEGEVRELYESVYQVECLLACDAMAENLHFQKRGMTQLTEKVYRLQKNLSL